ncbi:MAG: hypothetical protein PHX54_00970 [Lentimicrobiaceae bacterium]|nr:hypothetical protein [Lentimicrobiaceae bacterium]
MKSSQFFQHLNFQDFQSQFSDAETCLEWIAGVKWPDGYSCRKCGNTNYCKGKSPYSRRCTRCKSDESATAHTVFHHCRIPLPEAFKMAWMVCHNPEVSTYEIARIMDVRQMTCWNFKKRIMQCLDEGKGFELMLNSGGVNAK